MADRPKYFNPTISFDGVAVIVALITCCFWFGRLSEKVNRLEQSTAQHEATLAELRHNSDVMQTLITERTKVK